MAPLPPAAPLLPNLGEVLRRATEEGIRQGSALAKKKEKGKHWSYSLFCFLVMGSDAVIVR